MTSNFSASGCLLNEIFGEENHVGTIIWAGSTDNNPTRIATEHEYILCYAKNKTKFLAVWAGRQNETRDLMLAEYERIKARTKDVKAIQREFRKFIADNKEILEPLTHYSRVDEDGPFTGSRKVHNPGKDGYFYDVPYKNTKKITKKPARGYHLAPEKINGLERGVSYLLTKVRGIGPDAHQWAEAMLHARGIEGTRVLQGLISLARRYRVADLENACKTALAYGVFHLRSLRQLIGRKAQEQTMLPFLSEHPIIRPLADYGGVIAAALARKAATDPSLSHHQTKENESHE